MQRALGVFSISIHALLAESDQQKCGDGEPNINFYPRSPCGERLLPFAWHLLLQKISIHALLAESDSLVIKLPLRSEISIHALLAESDSLVNMRSTLSPVFLSTLSLRRATRPYCPQSRPLLFLSTLSLRRATIHYFMEVRKMDISIHALLAESDRWARSRRRPSADFYPRSPCGERLGNPCKKP